jgi:hypothetical protein
MARNTAVSTYIRQNNRRIPSFRHNNHPRKKLHFKLRMSYRDSKKILPRFVGFEILTEVVNRFVLWGITQCSPLKVN